MPTVVYRARSRTDLSEARALLTRHGIESTIVGDPDRSPAPGTKVYYLVELAVADEQSARARQVISDYQAAESNRIRHLTTPIRRGAIAAFAMSALLGMLGLIFCPELMGIALPGVLVVGLITLSIIASRKAGIRDRRRDRGQCIECGYSLRGNRSGRCPECGSPVSRRLRRRQQERG